MKLLEEKLLDSSIIYWYGRNYYNKEEKAYYLFNNIAGFIVKVKSTNFKVILKPTRYGDERTTSFIQIVVDHDFKNIYKFEINKDLYEINVPLDNNVHYIELYKQTEAIRSHIAVTEIEADNFLNMDYKYDHVIEVIGDSTTAGYGNLGKNPEPYSTANSDGLQDFAFLAGKRFNAEVNFLTASGWGVYASIWTDPKQINVCQYKDKVCVLSDIDYDYKNTNPELIVMSLGTNDGTYLREDPNLTMVRTKEFIMHYTGLILYKLNQYPNAKIVMIYGTINEVEMYENVEKVYENVKKYTSNVYLLRCHGDNGGANGHPSMEAHYNVAKELEDWIKDVMKW